VYDAGSRIRATSEWDFGVLCFLPSVATWSAWASLFAAGRAPRAWERAQSKIPDQSHQRGSKFEGRVLVTPAGSCPLGLDSLGSPLSQHRSQVTQLSGLDLCARVKLWPGVEPSSWGGKMDVCFAVHCPVILLDSRPYSTFMQAANLCRLSVLLRTPFKRSILEILRCAHPLSIGTIGFCAQAKRFWIRKFVPNDRGLL
jgi:hypothetical protein